LNKSAEITVNNRAGGNYVGSLVAGSYLEYLINVPAADAGEYRLSLNTATGNNNFQRVLSVFAGSAKLADLQVINGTNWEGFAPISANVTLSAGTHILHFVSTGAVNIENITLEKRAVGEMTVALTVPSGGFVYDGQAKTPAVSVSVGGATLAPAAYSVKYSDNTNAGTASAEITYEGQTKTEYFSIVKKEVIFTIQGEKEIKIDWDKEEVKKPQIQILPVGISDISVFKIGDRTLTTDDIYADYEYGKESYDDVYAVDDDGNLVLDNEGNPIITGTTLVVNNYPGTYPITIKLKDGDISELTADNYTAVADEGFVLLVTDPNNVSVKAKKKFDGKYGIVFANNLVSDKAEIIVRIPENAVARITIFDNLGNVVFNTSLNTPATELKAIWNLQNQNGRFVANGAYFVVVEAVGAGSARPVYRYSAKFGVKR
jgi:hypothetical protein